VLVLVLVVRVELISALYFYKMKRHPQ
jgi:hypothetical protein